MVFEGFYIVIYKKLTDPYCHLEDNNAKILRKKRNSI